MDNETQKKIPKKFETEIDDISPCGEHWLEMSTKGVNNVLFLDLGAG